jgi:DNA-binding IclR family transcriptional regulator
VTATLRTQVGVLDRCVAILRAIEAGHRSFAAIAAATSLTRPTAHRLLRSLEQHGLVLQADGVGYVLGPGLLGLAAAARAALPLRELARPALERLAAATGESAQLYVRDGDRRICVDTVDSEQELRTIVDVGAALPLTKGSAGKVLLAWSAQDASADPLAAHLAAIRRRGWAESHGERETGVASISAPVLGPDGAILAAVSVSAPESRLGPARVRRAAPAVTRAARDVERALAGDRSPGEG